MAGSLRLEAVSAVNAAELAAVVGDPASEWERRAERWPQWRNWIVRIDGVAVGFVQATTSDTETEVAWVIAAPWRGRGYAAAAAQAMLAGLEADAVIAHIAPGNVASQGVARRLGMTPGAPRADGEVRWSLPVQGREQRP